MANPTYIVDGVLTDPEPWIGLNTVTLGSSYAYLEWKSKMTDSGLGTPPTTDGGMYHDWGQFMDLIIICYARTDRSGTSSDYFKVQFNGDTGSNYNSQQVRSSGSIYENFDEGIANAFWGLVPGGTGAANVFGISVVTLFNINGAMDLTGGSWNAGDGYQTGGHWVESRSTGWHSQEPLDTIKILPNYGVNFTTGTSFSLFGILPKMEHS